MSKGRLIIYVFSLAIIILFVVIIANSWRNKTIISKLTIKGNITLSETDVLQAAGLRADSTIDLSELNEVFIRDRVARHPEIKRVVVSKEPTSELVIEIVEKKPFAIVL